MISDKSMTHLGNSLEICWKLVRNEWRLGRGLPGGNSKFTFEVTVNLLKVTINFIHDP